MVQQLFSLFQTFFFYIKKNRSRQTSVEVSEPTIFGRCQFGTNVPFPPASANRILRRSLIKWRGRTFLSMPSRSLYVMICFYCGVLSNRIAGLDIYSIQCWYALMVTILLFIVFCARLVLLFHRSFFLHASRNGNGRVEVLFAFWIFIGFLLLLLSRRNVKFATRTEISVITL